uniref:Uncharacterized protein n=1 Tax=Candidatus Kentrum sp. LFY TaxID=2126342 RepID=A0A450V578_9GAMM|nr:MAG: hypothetical protein BECKLFY1418B_GA0070995_11643 [Candidatus Kentron sp. LFY]
MPGMRQARESGYVFYSIIFTLFLFCLFPAQLHNWIKLCKIPISPYQHSASRRHRRLSLKRCGQTGYRR